VPVLMLTARGELSDRVVGLELGADDYLPKPFEPRELAARLATILRRARTLVSPVLRFDGLVIDTVRREVQRQAEPVELTGTEYELLLLLAREPNKVWTRDEILNRLRGQDALDLHTRAVDILVSRCAASSSRWPASRRCATPATPSPGRACERDCGFAPALARSATPSCALDPLAPGGAVPAAGAGHRRRVPGRHAAHASRPAGRAGRDRWWPTTSTGWRPRSAARRMRRAPLHWWRACRSRCASTGRRCSTTRTRADGPTTTGTGTSAMPRAAVGGWCAAPPTATACASAWPLPDPERPRRLGWFTLAALLVLTGAAYAVVHRLLRPLGPIGDGVARFGRGDFAQPIVLPRRDELGELAERINGMARSLHGMLEDKRRCCWPSATNCAAR
jgi:HAMP domain-containing protein